MRWVVTWDVLCRRRSAVGCDSGWGQVLTHAPTRAFCSIALSDSGCSTRMGAAGLWAANSPSWALTRSTLHPAVQHFKTGCFLIQCDVRYAREKNPWRPAPLVASRILARFAPAGYRPCGSVSVLAARCSVSLGDLVCPGLARKVARVRRGGGRTFRGGLCALRALGPCALQCTWAVRTWAWDASVFLSPPHVAV